MMYKSLWRVRERDSGVGPRSRVPAYAGRTTARPDLTMYSIAREDT
jgi:hypothetical protein